MKTTQIQTNLPTILKIVEKYQDEKSPELELEFKMEIDEYLDTLDYSFNTKMNKKFQIGKYLREELKFPLVYYPSEAEIEMYEKRKQHTLKDSSRFQVDLSTVRWIESFKNISIEDDRYMEKKLIYLQYVTGRRIGELYDQLIQHGTHILYQPLKKKKMDDNTYQINSRFQDEWITVNGVMYQSFTPLVSVEEVMDVYTQVHPWMRENTLSVITRRMNRNMKKILNSDDFTTHKLRGLYGQMMMKNLNVDEPSISLALSQVLNHSNTLSVSHYDKYKVENILPTQIICETCSTKDQLKILTRKGWSSHIKTKTHQQSLVK
jgi:integrase